MSEGWPFFYPYQVFEDRRDECLERLRVATEKWLNEEWIPEKMKELGYGDKEPPTFRFS